MLYFNENALKPFTAGTPRQIPLGQLKFKTLPDTPYGSRLGRGHPLSIPLPLMPCILLWKQTDVLVLSWEWRPLGFEVAPVSFAWHGQCQWWVRPNCCVMKWVTHNVDCYRWVAGVMDGDGCWWWRCDVMMDDVITGKNVWAEFERPSGRRLATNEV